jgi:hypothetical protein
MRRCGAQEEVVRVIVEMPRRKGGGTSLAKNLQEVLVLHGNNREI